MATTHNTAGAETMTKRQFDTMTKINFGGRMASDTYAGYCEDRCKPSKRDPYWFDGDKLSQRGASAWKPIHDRGEFRGLPNAKYRGVMRKCIRLGLGLPRSIRI